MECAGIKKLLSGYIERQLHPSETQEVKDHLVRCPLCRQEASSLEKTWAFLGEWQSIEPRPDYVSRFWTELALRAETPWYEKLKDFVTAPLRGHLAPAMVTACAVLLIGLFAVRNYWQAQRSEQILASLSPIELAMVEDIELAEDYEIIEQMDWLQDVDIIEHLDIIVES